MTDLVTCPPPEDLERFVLGRLNEAEAEQTQHHLAGCQACLDTLHGLESNDELLEAMRTQGEEADHSEKAIVQELIDHLSGLDPPPSLGDVTADAHSTAKSIDPAEFRFLAPATAPDEMGWLGGYRVLRVLGAGGMGVVFEADDPRLKRHVALKVLKPALAADTAARQRFLREAQAIAALEHDHIVAIHQVAEDNGVPFLAMPLLKGETLHDRLQRTGALPPGEALRIGREMALGLGVAHEQGLIHRDVKPANVWLEGPAARVKLLDFGLARPTADDAHLTREGTLAGTPHYMAPEQAAGQQVDCRCDLFSLGCVLYRMATGRLPFAGSDTLTVLRAIAVETPRSPRQVNPTVPQALSDLTMRLLARDPAARPSSAAEVVTALAAIERAALSPPARSRRLVWAAAAALVFVAVASLVTISIRTADGTLVVEIDDPEVEVTVEAGGGLLFRGAGPKEVRLPPGSYRWQATRNGEPVKTDVLTIIRDRKQIVRVTLEPAEFPVASQSPPPGPLDRLDPEKLPAAERFPWQPKELVQVLGEHRGRHWAEAGCAVFNADGTRIASSGADGAIRIWDAETLRELAVLTGHAGWVSSVAFSADGKFLLSGGDDRVLRLWDISSGKEIKQFAGHTASITTGLAFSGDGTRALSGAWSGDNSVRLWNLESGEEVLRCTGHTDGVRCVALSFDGLRALSGGNDRRVRLWDLKTGQELHCFDGHTDRVASVALSPDGRLALSGGGENDPSVRLWDLGMKREVHSFTGHSSIVLSVAFSPDGRRALSCDQHAIRLWDLSENRELHRFTSDAWVGNCWSVAFSKDGRRAVSSHGDHALRLWDIESRSELLPVRGHPGMASGVVFSPDGRQVLTGSPYDRIARLWDVATAREARRFEGHRVGVASVAIDTDGHRALSGGHDPDVFLWDLATGNVLLRLEGHPGGHTSVRFSPDGRHALSSGVGACLWDLTSGRPLRVFGDPAVATWSAIFSRDDRRVLVGSEHDPVVTLWDQGGRELKRFEGHAGGRVSVAFAPDGRRTWSAAGDGMVRLWDLASTEPHHQTFRHLHNGLVTALAVAPGGQTLASAGVDGRIILWDAASGVPQREWRLPGSVYGVAFAADGRHLATANANGTVYILRLAVLEAAK